MSGMTGIPPSRRGGRPTDPSLHAREIALEWEDVAEAYIRTRMKELGIPKNQIGQPDYDGDGVWRAFDAKGRKGVANTTGAVVDSGVLNPELLKGQKGGRIWSRMRLKDRIDATIAHEFEEIHAGGRHIQAVKNAAATKLPISNEARRLNRARAR